MSKTSAKKLKIAFVADPLEHFDRVAETTFFITKEICNRGWDCYHIELKDLYLLNQEPHAIAKRIHVTRKKGLFDYVVNQTATLKLVSVDAIFLRKDPPVDLNFMDHLAMLELLNDRVLLINNPSWVKLANEKLFTLHFDGLAPKTLVSQNRRLIRDFVNSEKHAVLKPLNLSGGRGVVKVRAGDPSLNSFIDILTKNESRYIMAQRFVPEAMSGDKRILILDGEILGAFLRIPGKGDFRGNLHSGARLVRCKLTRRDHSIVAQLKTRLKELGLYFVGIDIIGNYVTEINSTSPMGIREINHLDNSQIEKPLVDWLQTKLTNRV